MIKCFVGPMYSGKTSGILAMYTKIWNKESVICFKPKRDSREYGYIKSRDSSVTIDAICIDNIEDIYSYINNKTHTIFIDEAQFLKGDVNVLTELSIVHDMDIYAAGLNMTAEQKPFGIMPEIMAISDIIENVPAVCYECNKPARYTYYDGVKEDDILIGNNGYMPLCGKCLAKKKIKKM